MPRLKELFDIFDGNEDGKGDGKVNVDELETVLQERCTNPQYQKEFYCQNMASTLRIIEKADENKDGFMNLQEWKNYGNGNQRIERI